MAIIRLDDSCPNCGLKHRKFPDACLELVNDQLIEAQLEGDDISEKSAEDRNDSMFNYAMFWSLIGENKEREGDVD